MRLSTQTVLLRIDKQRFAEHQVVTGAAPETTGEIAMTGGCLDQ
jgi:hypothetical protein